MKKLFLASAAIVALSAPSYAADLAARPYTKAAPVAYAAPVTNWSGLYIGGFGGYGWSNNVTVGNPFVGATTFDTGELTGGFGGGTIGFNWQAPGSQFVWGIEVDAAGADIGTSSAAGRISASDSINAFGSVTGRLGIAANSALFYVKGGYGWANNQIDIAIGGVNVFSESNTHSGWTIGGGLEYMFAPNWSGKVEYQYYDLGTTNYAAAFIPGGIDIGASVHTVKAGINYHFNWGGGGMAPGY